MTHFLPSLALQTRNTVKEALQDQFTSEETRHRTDPNMNVRITEQELGDKFLSASADIALEPPDSGDFHESFLMPDGSGDIALLVGDVTGHGAAASMKAQAIRKETIAHLKAGDSPLETIQAANSVDLAEDDRFSTLFVAKLSGKTNEISYANAGHEPPLVADEDGQIQQLAATGPPLGVTPPGMDSFEERKATLESGCTLVVTTDGVTEARRPSRGKPKFFGQVRLRTLVSHLSKLSPSRTVQEIIGRILTFTRSVLNDDIVVMAIKRRHKPQSRHNKSERYQTKS
jgi:sigma-B regulation protein RsbU (phosphoserine phosphatase)